MWMRIFRRWLVESTLTVRAFRRNGLNAAVFSSFKVLNAPFFHSFNWNPIISEISAFIMRRLGILSKQSRSDDDKQKKEETNSKRIISFYLRSFDFLTWHFFCLCRLNRDCLYTFHARPFCEWIMHSSNACAYQYAHRIVELQSIFEDTSIFTAPAQIYLGNSCYFQPKHL